jgi:hypothetical protein
LYSTEHLENGRLPFLDKCPADSSGECDEYPVLTMYFMRTASGTAHDATGFYTANALMLSIAAIVIAVCLYMMAGARALFFVLAPTLAIYGLMNWDLLAVAFATGATLAYFRKRDVLSGILIGLGTAAKFYPALLAVPFILGRFKEKKPDRGIHLAWAAAGAWLVVNLPFALKAPSSWFEFFRFNSARGADWDSLWLMGCHAITHEVACPTTLIKPINAVSGLMFVVFGVFVWRLRRRRDPAFPRWTFAFPMLVLFLLTSKVYSPQYGLWLLPWFALALPSWRLFALFELADIGVFVTRFSYFGRLDNVGGFPFGHGSPFGLFETAILIRAVVLVVCLVAWIRRPAGDPLPALPDSKLQLGDDGLAGYDPGPMDSPSPVGAS